ncbi:glycoside hydrolase family 32 protein [Pedobacter sp. PF22-3]|uniref:glycoside hydrolase family 32 protein n=1 Tax=Pedobacter sp. PF22-3 TaxID=2994467 RepID=UPI002245CC83|nr:glycoside hydrolase family 32 protein [Pedobacter sp. PF22-3]MCX2492212.1 glycoside hydrolase family 32 protein [Pedobacter sp. PF22-3]
MEIKRNLYFGLIIASFFYGCASTRMVHQKSSDTEPYRPKYHFTPKAHWMNDPNGMVYLNGKYHLFFQYNPDSTVWGPMHWAHAISKDMIHWEEQPIALYPDNLGTIFSGSAVIDKDNTAGFGKNAMVAIFTHHNKKIEDQKTGLHQYQSLAYSLDEGKTWTKYKGNPVLPNPGIWDFRDPKVMWHAATGKWLMTLATKDRITFYSSTDLKKWSKESEFGEKLGAHGGVWECPDLFPLELNGKTHWILLVSINPGGPNGGSATQYFTGDFDGKTFKPDSDKQKWMDYGTDNYAGVTFSNTGARKVLMGWMNNWNYANVVPTGSWRGATTLPRDLSLKKVGEEIYLASAPVKEVSKLEKVVFERKELTGINSLDLSAGLNEGKGTKIEMQVNGTGDFGIELGDGKNQKLIIGFEKNKGYFIDRSKAGNGQFEQQFAEKHFSPRISNADSKKIIIFIDAASVELFADDGLTAMTEIFFPIEKNILLKLKSSKKLDLKMIKVSRVSSTN